MRKIFYRPETLEIMGMSDGENSLDFPFLETEEKLHSTEGVSILQTETEAKLLIDKKTLEL